MRNLGTTRAALAAAILTSIGTAQGADDCAPLPFEQLPETPRHLARPLPLLELGGAVVIPLAFVPTGVDHRARVLAQDDLGGRHDLEPVSVVAPYIIAGGVLAGYGVSFAAGACAWQRPQAAMVQAMALTFGTVVLLKWSVGRGWPNAGGDPGASDRLDHPEWARRFEPFANGFGAWPSGHSAIAFSAAAALRASSPELGWPAWLGYPIAAAIGVGMWIGDHHFASDVLSGALLGEAIGASSGAAYAREEAPEQVLLVPARFGSGAVALYARPW